MIFGTLNTSASGLHVYRQWLDAVSDNVSNIDTVRPTNQPAFQERFIVAQANQADYANGEGGGASVAGVALGNAQGRMVYEPSNPQADANGYVRYPDIDLGDQMVHMMMAQRGYEANLSVIDRAKDAYQQALNLGK